MKQPSHVRIGTSRFVLLLQGVAIAAILLCAASAQAATTLTVTSPASGKMLTANGTSYGVEWKTSTKVTNAFHFFLIPQKGTPVLPPPPVGGSSVTFLEDFGGYNVGWSPTPVASASHSGTFTLDRDVPEGTYTLRIYATNSNIIMKPSDAVYLGESEPFTVRRDKASGASVTLISPNGGETWVVGNPQILRYKTSGIATLQLALQNLSTGQPCVIATNINARAGAWMVYPLIGMPCIGSMTQSLVPGQYRAALYDNNWASTRASAYSDKSFTIAATSKTKESDIERLTNLVMLLSEIVKALQAAR